MVAGWYIRNTKEADSEGVAVIITVMEASTDSFGGYVDLFSVTYRSRYWSLFYVGWFHGASVYVDVFGVAILPWRRKRK